MKKFYDILYWSFLAFLTIFVGIIVYQKVASAEPATIYVLGGHTVSNSVSDEHSKAWGIEQSTPTKYGLWDFGYLNEGHMDGDKRDGIYAMREFVYQFSPRIKTSFAIGPYFTATTLTQDDEVHYIDHYSWAVLAGASVKYRVDGHWSLMGRWNHVLYADQNKDSDIFLIGAGYTPMSW
jgi:hypothetical protein